MLVAVFERSEAVALDRMTWRAKMTLADALGLVDQNDAAVLVELNRVRNRLAHDLAGEPSDEDIRRLVSTSSEPLRASTESLLDLLRESDEPEHDPDQLDTELRYWFFAMVIYLDWRFETQAYERRHRDEILIAEVVRVATKRRGGPPLTKEAAEAARGLPPRPKAGDTYVSRGTTSGTDHD